MPLRTRFRIASSRVLLFIAALLCSLAKSNEARPLSDVLMALSAHYGVSIVFHAADVESYEVIQTDLAALLSPEQPLKQSLEQILETLLQNTELIFVTTADGLIIQPRENKPTFAPTEQSEILVTGYRASLINAREIKRDSLTIVDAIVAEDIADFPDLNLADALQRIPGVAINREAGEGRQVSLRGMGPEFVLVTLNGMETLGNTDSPMDSRGQKTRNRAFDFNLFAAELFSDIRVKKAYQVNDTEGGIAGTLALRTPKPFDHPGLNIVSSFTLADNNLTEDIANRWSGLIANTGERWGGLVSFALHQRDTQEQGANTSRWRRESPNGADISALSAPLQQQWMNQDIFVPRGNRYSLWQAQQLRAGMTAVLQYQTDAFDWGIEGIVSQLHNDRQEYHLYPRGKNSTPVIPGVTRVEEAEVNSANELVYARYTDAQMATESREQRARAEFRQGNMWLRSSLADRLEFRGLLGVSRSHFNMPESNKIYTEGVSDVRIDYRPDPFYGQYRYSSDTRDNKNWWLHEVDVEEYYTGSQYAVAKLDFNYTLSGKGQWEWGYHRNAFTNRTARQTAENLFREEWEERPQAVWPSLTRILDRHRELEWMTMDTGASLHFLGLDNRDLFRDDNGGDFGLEDSRDKIKEQSHGAYLKWQTESFDKVSWNLGMRFFSTSTDLPSGHSIEYQGWLPALNVRLPKGDNHVFKLALSRNITRPDLVALSQTSQIFNQDTQTPTLRALDAELKPYLANNLEVAWESYFSESGYVSWSVFYKHIQDYIVTQRKEVFSGSTEYNSLIRFTDFPDDSVSDEEQGLLWLTRTNAETVDLIGMEWAYQQDWRFLPEPWNYFGTNIHLTLVEGKAPYYDDHTGRFLFEKTLPQQSRYSHSMTLYYETPKWGARLSSHYRSDFITQVDSSVLDEEDERGFHASHYIDAQMHIKLADQWKIQLEALNVTEEREEQYSDSSRRVYNTTESGRTWMLGVTYHY